MDGVMIVDKPEGLTSADVVRIAKRRLRLKVGHLGTLDPFATGVLPLCLGEGTKIARFLLAADKRYMGSIKLGAETDTADCTGRVVRRAEVPLLRPTELDALAGHFVGENWQTPPMYSAVKHGGVRLYKLARAGKEVDRPARRISIYGLVLKAVAADRIAFEVHCSKGTYVRTLAEDIGAALQSAAHLDSLRRTAVGSFWLKDATTVAELETGGQTKVIGLRAALGHLREISVGGPVVRRIQAGQQSVLHQLPPAAAGEIAKLIDSEGCVVAVVSATRDRGWRFERVFHDRRTSTS